MLSDKILSLFLTNKISFLFCHASLVVKMLFLFQCFVTGLYNRWFYKTPFHQFYLSNHNADFDSCISFCASMEGSRLAINPLGLLQNTLDKHDHYWANDNAASFTDIANRKCSLLISCPEESPGCSNLRFKNFSVTCSTEAHCICERIDVRFTKRNYFFK